MAPNVGDDRGRKFLDIAGKPGFLGALARFWQRSYAADYICLIVITVAWFLVSDIPGIRIPMGAFSRAPCLFVAHQRN